MKKYFILCLLALLSAFPTAAQSTEESAPEVAEPPAVRDSLAQAWADSLRSLTDRFKDWRYTGADTLTNPYYFMLFSSSTFYDPAMHRLFCGSTKEGTLLDRTCEALGYIYTRHPWLVTNIETSTRPEKGPEKETYVKPAVKLTDTHPEKGKTERIAPLPELDIEVRKPNFWKFKGDFSFQLIQNYVTDNWYKGGESNHSMLAAINVQANYDNKQKLTFSNRLEMKLGFQSSRSDKKRRYKTNSDMIRLTNELGLKAVKHWSYSAMLQSWTQFCHGYRSNDDKVYSDFMSPFESLFTLGMKYTLDKNRFTLTLNLSPFAGDFKYVARSSLETSFGLKENHHTKFEFGSNITANYKWNVMKNVTWNGRFYWYTNYSKTVIECENTINLKINKYLATQLFLYPRFDDSVTRSDPEDSYFQFKEYLSVGLNVGF